MDFKNLFSKKRPSVDPSHESTPPEQPASYNKMEPLVKPNVNPHVVDAVSVQESIKDSEARIPGITSKVAHPNTTPELKPLDKDSWPQQSARSFEKPIIPAWPKYTRPLPSKDVFAFVVENSNDVAKYKDLIVSILNNIVKNKTNAIFVFVRVGNGKKSFVPMDYNELTEQKIISSLFSENEPVEQVNLAPALYYIRNIIKVFNDNEFSFKNQKYKLNSFSVICVGSSSFIDSEYVRKTVTTCIKEITEMPKLKTFKYFCLKDSDSIKLASLGFPVIGHIVSNFYS